VDVLAAACAEVVQHVYVKPLLEEAIDEVRSDEAG
jgi:hypothetical protein